MKTILTKINSDAFSLNNNVLEKDTKLLNELTEIVSATIKTIDHNKVVLSADNTTISIETSKNEISGNVGDKVSIELKKDSNESYKIKQIFSDVNYKEKLIKEKGIQDKAKNVLELFNKNNTSLEDNNILNGKLKVNDDELKKIQILNKIKRDLAFGYENINTNVINELVSNGISLGKISLPILSNVIKETKNSNSEKLSKSDVKKAVQSYIIENNGDSKNTVNAKIAIKKLAENNVKITEKNIEALESVILKTTKIENLSDSSLSNILSNETNFTLENVYRNNYISKTNDTSVNLADEIIKDLESDIKKTLENENLEVTNKILKESNFLVKNNIPLSKVNLNKLKFLKNFKATENLEDIMDKAANNIKKDINVSEINLLDIMNRANTENLTNEYNQIINMIPNIKDQNIIDVVRNNNAITLNNIRLSTEGQKTNSNYDSKTDISNIKLQLATLQSKLTHEAANRLANKNISINTIPLKNAITTLQELEKENYSKNLKLMQVEETSKNIDSMYNLFDTLKNFNKINDRVFSDIFSKKTDFTIKGIDNSLKSNINLDSYNTFATMPSTKHKDSFSKVKEQFVDLLNNMGIKPTKQNIKAATILSKNNLDVNNDSITQIKLIDSKINEISNKLLPNIAATIIREGLNPMDLHVDQVLNYIEKYKDTYSETTSDKISNHILEMDKKKNIDETTRKSMIAIYRMLNTIKNNESVSLGVAIKNNSNLTLGNLLEASKYYSKTKGKEEAINIKLDNNFGELKENSIPENSIRGALEKNKSKQFEYNNINIDNLSEELNPDILKDIIKNENIYQKPLEELILEVNEYENTYQKIENINIETMNNSLDFINDVLVSSPNSVYFMQMNQIPLTMDNITFAKRIIDNQNYTFEQINELSQIELDSQLEDLSLSTKLDGMKNGVSPDDIMKNMSKQLEMVQKATTDSNTIKKIKLARNAIKIQDFINKSKNTGIFTLPIKLHDKIASLNMHIINNNLSTKEETNAFMALDTTNLGDISIGIRQRRNKVDLKISAEDNHSLEALKNNEYILIDYLKQEGIKIDDISFDIQPTTNLLKQEVEKTEELKKNNIDLKSKYNISI